MKRYKVKNILNGYILYFESRKAAKDHVNNCPERRRLLPGSVELSYHHTASKKGYITKDHGYFESYAGRFGKGLIYHQPNNQGSPHNSNNYHYITYYIEQ